MPTRILCATVVLSALAHASAWGAAFVVNDLADAVDAAPGNGACATARGTCTLRAAVQETNALAGADQIDARGRRPRALDPRAHEDAAATGDLDITDDLTIAGANAYLSVIDANGIDRVIDQLAAAAPLDLTLRDLTISGGDTDGKWRGRCVTTARFDAERNHRHPKRAQFRDWRRSRRVGHRHFDEPALDPECLDRQPERRRSTAPAESMSGNSQRRFRSSCSIVIANTAGNSGGGDPPVGHRR